MTENGPFRVEVPDFYPNFFRNLLVFANIERAAGTDEFLTTCIVFLV